MTTKPLRGLVIGLLLLVTTNTFSLPTHSKITAPDSGSIIGLSPTWVTGILSDNVGLAGILVEDMNGDGKAETMSCSNDYAYALAYESPGVYQQIWYSENINCKALAIRKAAAGNYKELYVLGKNGHIRSYDGRNFLLLSDTLISFSGDPTDIKIGDVDNDGIQEIVVSTTTDTFVYDSITQILKWKAEGYGGSQLGIGNIDNDPAQEIIVNGSPAHVLDANKKTQEWAYAGGFGSQMSLGDVDRDGHKEIAAIQQGYTLFVFDVDSFSTTWQRNDIGELSAITAFDINNDGYDEIIIGNGQWGKLSAFKGSDGTFIDSIINPKHGVSGIGVGDTNQDGVQEIWWGTGLTSGAKDALLMGNWISKTVEWSSDGMDGPLYVTTGDVDNDNQAELIMASTGLNGYYGGVIKIYDGKTHKLKWQNSIGMPFYKITNLFVDQLDNDPALEIIVAGNFYNEIEEAGISVFDGISHELQWKSPSFGTIASSLALLNFNGDSIQDIAIGLNNAHIIILRGASPIILWDSGALDGPVLDISIGDLDGNGVVDIAGLTDKSIYVFEGNGVTPKLKRSFSKGEQILVAKNNSASSGSLIIAQSYLIGSQKYTYLTAWNSAVNSVIWQKIENQAYIEDIIAKDLNNDNQQELIIIGKILNSDNKTSSSLIKIGALSADKWRFDLKRNRGPLTSISFADLDSDGKIDIALGAATSIEIDKIVDNTLLAQHTLLPWVESKSIQGIYGQATLNDYPISNVELELRHYDGNQWSTALTTTTQVNGYFSFINAPSLSDNHKYYVRYKHSDLFPNTLSVWASKLIEHYGSGEQVNLGSFEIGDITLVSPENYGFVTLPSTFTWIPRYASLTDSYELDIFSSSGNPYFYTQPLLGFTNSYTLTTLPSGFSPNYSYYWNVWIYSPNGGYGISNITRDVYFTNRGINSDSFQSNPTHKNPYGDTGD